MDTQNSTDSSAQDTRPPGQQARAKDAHLNPNQPAIDAEAGTPQYGDFGKPTAQQATGAHAPAGRSGSNDNPDELSEIHDDKDPQGHPKDLEDQPGHVDQNQDTPAVPAAHDADNDDQRAAWTKDDPRYAGGGTNNADTGANPETATRNANAVDKSANNRA